MKSSGNIDDLFKSKFEGHTPAFNPAHWQQAETMIVAQGNSGSLLWWFFGIGIVITLGLGTLWWTKGSTPAQAISTVESHNQPIVMARFTTTNDSLDPISEIASNNMDIQVSTFTIKPSTAAEGNESLGEEAGAGSNERGSDSRSESEPESVAGMADETGDSEAGNERGDEALPEAGLAAGTAPALNQNNNAATGDSLPQNQLPDESTNTSNEGLDSEIGTDKDSTTPQSESIYVNYQKKTASFGKNMSTPLPGMTFTSNKRNFSGSQYELLNNLSTSPLFHDPGKSGLQSGDFELPPKPDPYKPMKWVVAGGGGALLSSQIIQSTTSGAGDAADKRDAEETTSPGLIAGLDLFFVPGRWQFGGGLNSYTINQQSNYSPITTTTLETTEIVDWVIEITQEMQIDSVFNPNGGVFGTWEYDTTLVTIIDSLEVITIDSLETTETLEFDGQNIQHSFIEIPLSAGYSFPIGQKSELTVHQGLTLGILRKTSGGYLNPNGEITPYQKESAQTMLTSFTRLRFSRSIGYHLSLYAEASYRRTMRSPFKMDDYRQQYHLLGSGFGVSYKF